MYLRRGFKLQLLVPLQLILLHAKNRAYLMRFETVCCDWMTFRHEYAEPISPKESGRILRIDPTGEIEWETQQWEQIRCPSSDTSIRVRCDGRTLKGMANIGRFQQPDNLQGLTVLQCVERWREVLGNLGFDITGFGSRWREDTPAECGTYLTRLDLAGNFDVSDYSGLCSAASIRRIGQKLPALGKYGPTWGYDAKRSNWWKAKLYDKTAELDGKRRSSGGMTTARFEVQLGSEYLKREKLDRVSAWKDEEMAQIIYGKFATPVFRESVSVEDWSAIPMRLRHWAILWRDGVDLRGQMSLSQFYRVRSKLMEFGVDVGTPCNVVALARHSRIVEVTPVSALRRVA